MQYRLCWQQCLALLLFLTVLGIGCNNTPKNTVDGVTTTPMRDINVVKEAHVNELMTVPGVVGVYVGTLDNGTPCIGVMVIRLTAELQQKIPQRLEGYPVNLEETGEIKPMK